MSTRRARSLPISTPSGAPSCSLSPADLTRRRVALAELAGAATRRVASVGGITLSFPLSDALLELVCSALRAEASCCPAFRYVLAVEPSDHTFELTVCTDLPEHARWLRSVYLEHVEEGETRV